MTTFAAFALSGLLAAAGGTVTFDVKKGGDVKWKSAPCTAEVHDASGATVQAGFDVEKGANLDAGRYVAVVACESDEGTVKRSVDVNVRDDDVKVPVSIDPGFLLVNVLRFDTPVRAEITVFDERDQEVARSKEKAVIPLAQGKVKLLAKVDPSSFSGGGPRPVFATATATVVPRQKTNVTIDSTDGELTVSLVDNGRKAGGVVALRAPGQTTRLVELRAGEKATVPPGTYDLVTQLEDTHDFSEVVTKNIVIAPKKHTQRSVAHKTGMLKPVVLVQGKKPADAKIDVELLQPGATAPFNTVALGDAIKMAPGPVELVARRTDAPLDDGTHPVARVKTTVSAGAQKPVTLDIRWATLDVATTIGKQPRALDVEVAPAPAAKGDASAPPVAKKTAGADGKASFALSPGKYVVRAILKAPQGDVVATQSVSLALGSKLAAKLNLDLGTAVVQVFESGVAVPAEVRFHDPKTVKDGRPTADPVLSVPAGQEALLPPGTYALFVKRKGEERGYSDAKIAAGRTFERTVDVTPAPPTTAPAAPAKGAAPTTKDAATTTKDAATSTKGAATSAKGAAANDAKDAKDAKDTKDAK